MSNTDASPQIVEAPAPVPVDQSYSYFAPPALALAPGDHVEIPLGTRKAYGVVWEVRPAWDGHGNLTDLQQCGFATH